MASEIYLDHNATTPVEPAVLEVMLRCMADFPGNPSSRHAAGRRARQVVEEASEKIARGLGADVDEVTFTSGATEANNLALASMAEEATSPLFVLATEHPSSLEPARALAVRGVPVRVVPVDSSGRAILENLPSSCRLVVQYANSETGVIQDLKSIHQRVGSVERFHVDAVQAVGRAELSFRHLPASTLSISGHKIGGPPGIGALLVRKGTVVRPMLRGGEQQAGLRPGSEPVALIAGLGKAVECATERLSERAQILAELRDALEQQLLLRVENTFVNGSREHRLPNTLNVSFVGARAEAVLMGLDLDGVRASAGTACASGSMEPSPVLLAMGLPPERVASAVRFSVAPSTTRVEINDAVDRIARVVAKVRARLT